MTKTILVILAIILFIGTIGEKEKTNKKIYGFCFAVCVAAVTAIEIIGRFV